MPASRFLRPLLTAFLGLAALGSLRAAPVSVDYFSNVTYNLVITRASTVTTTATTERSTLNVELFNNRDLLRVILAAQSPAITDLRGWSLVARGNSATFSDSSTIASLELGARHRDGRFFALPPGAALSFSLLTPAPTTTNRVIDRGALPDDPADDTLVSETRDIDQLAVLSQQIPAVPESDLVSTGNVEATGLLSHGTVYGTFRVVRDTVGPYYRPTAATYQATGTFSAADPADDGLVEVQISFGTLSVRGVNAD
jgi:hypothetical protein